MGGRLHTGVGSGGLGQIKAAIHHGRNLASFEQGPNMSAQLRRNCGFGGI
jgi:hypothetical protein